MTQLVQKYLTRLRLGLCHLNEHKFSHNFQDCLNQALAYQACNRRRMPLHMLKTLETCKKKSLFCLIKKASRCAADRTSKTITLTFTFYIITQRSYEKIMCIYLLFDWFSGENCVIFPFSLHKGRQTSTDLNETWMMEQLFF